VQQEISRHIISDPLRNCITSAPTRWPGRAKLEVVSNEQSFNILRTFPGVWFNDNIKAKPEEQGWFVPQCLIDMGFKPGLLQDYPLDPYPTMPSGLKLKDYQRRCISFMRDVNAQSEGKLLVADPGLGKCRHPHTFIYTNEMGPIRIADIPLGEVIRSTELETLHKPALKLSTIGFDESTNTFCITPIHYVYMKKTNDELFEVVTENGYEDIVLGEHKFLTVDPTGNLVYKRADELSEDDWLAIPRTLPSKNNWDTWNPDVIQLTAFWLADGGGHKERFNTKQNKTCYAGPTITSYISLPQAFALAYKLNVGTTITGSGRSINLGIRFGRILEDHGFNRRTVSRGKSISRKLFSLNEKDQIEFIKELFSHDGTINEQGNVEYTCKEELLSQQISALLLKNSVHHSKTEIMKQATNGTKIKRKYYRITFSSLEALKFLSKIGFNETGMAIRRKSDVLISKNDLANMFIKRSLETGNNTNCDIFPCNKLLQQIRERANTGYRKMDLKTETPLQRNGNSIPRVIRALETRWPDYLDENALKEFEPKIRQLTDTFRFLKVKSVTKTINDLDHVMDIETGLGHSYLGGKRGFFVSHNTITSLQALWLDGFLQRPGLVIGPNIAKSVWCDDDSDARVHYNLLILSLEGVKNINANILTTYNCFYVHYDIVHIWQPWIFAILKPHWVILDESHYLINGSAQRTKATRAITMCASIERR
jgi:intein/homing endonuclease